MKPVTFESALERYQPIAGDWEAFLEACHRPLGTTGWFHPMRPDSGIAEGDGITIHDMSWRGGGFRARSIPPMNRSLAYRAGLIHIQEEASLLPVHMLRPEPGERILDLCAAPGNKTAEIAAALGGRGTVVANDLISGRLNVLRMTRDRLGLANIATTQLDGCAAAWPPAHFDAVLVDAPCSCEGTLRRHPRALTRSRAADRGRLAVTQTALLRNALRIVRPGGRVVYSTCTFAPEENEAVVTDALTGLSDFNIEDAADLEGLACSPGLTSWKGRSFHAGMDRAVRLWPGQADTGGFFSVIIRRAGPGAIPAAPADGCHSAPPDPIIADVLEFLTDSFGLPRGWESNWRFRHRGRSIDVEPTDHWLGSAFASGPNPAPVPVDPRGFSLVRMGGRVPKLSTQGALWLGSQVGAQYIELTRDEAWAYIRGESVAGGWSTAAFGYVQVRHKGVALGVGLHWPERQTLESLYPKHWGGLNG